LDSLAIKTDGTLWAWGHGGNGQIGIGSQQTITVPTKVGNDTDWKDILPGYASSKAIKTDGTLWAWGAHCGNWQFSFVPYMIGQSAATFGSSSKYEFEPILNTVGSIINPCTNSSLFDSNSVWKSVSVGGSSISNGPLFALAIKADGTLWSYGDNSQGQLGDGTTVNRSAPVQISTETNWSIVAAGHWAGYAIKTDGSLWSWGSNSMGQLGIPEFNALIPTIVEFK
jgi:alpha-tubulin suppressor-like RCC1 family protein